MKPGQQPADILRSVAVARQALNKHAGGVKGKEGGDYSDSGGSGAISLTGGCWAMHEFS